MYVCIYICVYVYVSRHMVVLAANKDLGHMVCYLQEA